MKALKIIGQVVLTVIAILVCLFFYFDSDFYEVRRLRSQVELNLKLQLSELPKLIDRESYGWAEEGGNKALLALNRQDCIAISNVMTNSENSHKKSEYFDMYEKNSVRPNNVKTWFKINEHGDSTRYALDEKSCYLYRIYHYE